MGKYMTCPCIVYSIGSRLSWQDEVTRFYFKERPRLRFSAIRWWISFQDLTDLYGWPGNVALSYPMCYNPGRRSSYQQEAYQMSVTTLAQVASLLTEPFVRTGVYASPEQALKHIILDYIERQIAWAEAELWSYEHKHQHTFAEWTESLSERATITDEDDWMEWEAVLDMLDGWRQIKAKVEQSSV